MFSLVFLVHFEKAHIVVFQTSLFELLSSVILIINAFASICNSDIFTINYIKCYLRLSLDQGWWYAKNDQEIGWKQGR